VSFGEGAMQDGIRAAANAIGPGFGDTAAVRRRLESDRDLGTGQQLFKPAFEVGRKERLRPGFWLRQRADAMEMKSLPILQHTTVCVGDFEVINEMVAIPRLLHGFGCGMHA
jgi:hypothetical protein